MESGLTILTIRKGQFGDINKSIHTHSCMCTHTKTQRVPLASKPAARFLSLDKRKKPKRKKLSNAASVPNVAHGSGELDQKSMIDLECGPGLGVCGDRKRKKQV